MRKDGASFYRDYGMKYSTIKPTKANWWLQSFTTTTVDCLSILLHTCIALEIVQGSATRGCFAWLKDKLLSTHFCIPSKHYDNVINLQAFGCVTSGLHGNGFIGCISSGYRANVDRTGT